MGDCVACEEPFATNDIKIKIHSFGDDRYSTKITIAMKLVLCVPELVFDAKDENICICYACSATLEEYYTFRIMCVKKQFFKCRRPKIEVSSESYVSSNIDFNNQQPDINLTELKRRFIIIDVDLEELETGDINSLKFNQNQVHCLVNPNNVRPTEKQKWESSESEDHDFDYNKVHCSVNANNARPTEKRKWESSESENYDFDDYQVHCSVNANNVRPTEKRKWESRESEDDDDPFLMIKREEDFVPDDDRMTTTNEFILEEDDRRTTLLHRTLSFNDHLKDYTPEMFNCNVVLDPLPDHYLTTETHVKKKPKKDCTCESNKYNSLTCKKALEGYYKDFSYLDEISEKSIEELYCTICSKACSVRTINNHMNDHCRICLLHFEELTIHVHEHRLSCYSEMKGFFCNICKTFAKLDHFLVHLPSLQNSSPKNVVGHTCFKCSTCNKIFQCETDLEKHDCNIKTKISKKSTRRSRVVLVRKQIRCATCKKCFFKHNYAKHLCFKCSTCDEQFQCKSDLDNHGCNNIKTFKKRGNPPHGKKITCEACKKYFFSHVKLVGHRCITNNKQKSTYVISSRYGKKITCEACKKHFFSRVNFVRHMCITNNKQKSTYVISNRHGKKITCEACKKHFFSRVNFVRHMCITNNKQKSTYVISNRHGKKITCETCKKHFFSRVNFVRHMCCTNKDQIQRKSDCNNIKPKQDIVNHKNKFKCDNCNRIFRVHDNYVAHTCFKYKCSSCDEPFSQRRQIDRHDCNAIKRKETKTCDLCHKIIKKDYTHACENLKNEVRKQCPICLIQFALSDFGNHIKVHIL